MSHENRHDRYTGFPDVNSLAYLWFKDFEGYRLCVIGGDEETKRSFTCLSLREDAENPSKGDVLLCHAGDHFTLLRPSSSSGASQLDVSSMLKSAVEAGHTVWTIVVDPCDRGTVKDIVRSCLEK
jgi:hypothetical protein